MGSSQNTQLPQPTNKLRTRTISLKKKKKKTDIIKRRKKKTNEAAFLLGKSL